MAIKKSDLYSSLWASCDELRGGMDASQYKDYVLFMLFVKYVSDKYAGDPNALIEVPAGGGHDSGNEAPAKCLNGCEARQAALGEVQELILAADGQWREKLPHFHQPVRQCAAILEPPSSVALAHERHREGRRCRATTWGEGLSAAETGHRARRLPNAHAAGRRA